MRAWSRLVWKLQHLWRRNTLERELQEEVQFHLAQLEQNLRESGAGAAEARRAARREFGNVGLVMEESRTPSCHFPRPSGDRSSSPSMLFSMKPNVPTIEPLPSPLERLAEAALPSWSMALIWVVPRLAAGWREANRSHAR